MVKQYISDEETSDIEALLHTHLTPVKPREGYERYIRKDLALFSPPHWAIVSLSGKNKLLAIGGILCIAFIVVAGKKYLPAIITILGLLHEVKTQKKSV